MVTKTRVAVLLTVLYLGVIAYFRGPDAWCLLRGGELNELGDFLAGVLTPVALFWLIFGYFLQRDEFRLQRDEFHLQTEELGLQREELEKTRETLSTQVEVMREQAEAERLRVLPNLLLEEGGISSQDRGFILKNIGGPARELQLIFVEESSGHKAQEKRELLDRDQFYDFSLLKTPSPRIVRCRACFISERHERFEQRWTITFTGTNPPVEIRRLGGPTLLTDS